MVEVPHKITNSVYLLDFGEKVNSEAIIEKFSNIEYNPETFPGIIMKVDDSIKLLIFTSGKIMAVGIKKDEDLKKAIEYIKNIMRKTGSKNVRDPVIKPINITVYLPDLSKALGTNYLDLDELVFYLDNVNYEPDMFPALFYKFYLKNGKLISVTLFKNARANLSGARNEEEIEMAKKMFIEKLKKVLEEIKKNKNE